MLDILEAALYALIFLAASLIILGFGYYVLDVLTPGHKLGDKLVGSRAMYAGATGDDGYIPEELPSYSAGLVTSAWMIMQGAIIFTAIWTNAHGTDLWAALGWTVAFSIVGLVLQSIAFVALDWLTPGRLGDEVCTPGPVVPLAMVAAANIVAIGLVVIASIS